MASAGRARIGVLLSGSGTNLQAMLDARAAGVLETEIAIVLSDREDAYGLVRAREAGVPAIWLDRGAHATSASYNAAIRDTLRGHGVDLVVMAGYMRLLGREVLDAFPLRVLNIHPSLLPAFPGANGIRDAYEYGVKVTGVTVHFANERFDEGPIIAQEAVSITESDTLESLEARIHAVEHALYPRVLQWITRGLVSVEGRRVRIRAERG